jgi:hexosaminidase
MFVPGPTWCNYAFWKNIYGGSILEGIPEECQDNVIGAFAAAWSEVIDESNLMTRVFPRAFALAERLWANPVATGTDQDIDIWLPALQKLRIVNQNTRN